MYIHLNTDTIILHGYCFIVTIQEKKKKCWKYDTFFCNFVSVHFYGGFETLKKSIVLDLIQRF